ncbi:hypothetical protein FNW54_11450 [Bacteroides sp. HF-5092]|uniref:hypothetical protein n=1 Tax=Bacteroides TaxID=816 RepID=UPI001177619F|nr:MULTISPECIES: hypothetical protein [Bacteroides]TRX45176.1 hypothetical protein FNW54_11450 [Bacteroides sp. HF-5092]
MECYNVWQWKIYSSCGHIYYTAHSNDGANWTVNTKTFIGYSSGRALVYGNGKFVVVGTDNQTAVYGGAHMSTNGEVWTGPITTLGGRLLGITYGNGKFVAVGEYGTSVSSVDGITWTYSSIPDTDGVGNSQQYFYGIAYGNGKFIAVGGGKRYSTSSDGKAWSTKIMLSDGKWPILRAITYANGRFVVVGDEGFIAYSTDGESWVKVTVPNSKWLAISYNNGKFVAVGNNGYVTTSIDGENWTTPEQIKDESGKVVTVQLNGVCVMP